MFRGSSHCSTSPPSHRIIFTISSTQDFSHREPPLSIWVIQTRSTQRLSQPTTTSTLEARHNNNHLYTQRDGHLAKQQSPHTRGIRRKAKQQPQSPLHLEGYQQTQLHNLLYTQRERHKAKAKERVTTLGGLNKPRTNFLTKTRSYRQDSI